MKEKLYLYKGVKYSLENLIRVCGAKLVDEPHVQFQQSEKCFIIDTNAGFTWDETNVTL